MTVFANSSDSSGLTQVLHFQCADQIVEFNPPSWRLLLIKNVGVAIDSAPNARSESRNGREARRFQRQERHEARESAAPIEWPGSCTAVAEVLLVFVEGRRASPKTPVGAREFGDFRSGFCVRMYLRQRKVPKDKSQTFAEMTLDALE